MKKKCHKMTNNTHNLSRRTSLKCSLFGATAVGVWHTPIINTIIIPAHAQTSASADSISASSLDSNNPFSRFLLIVDQNDAVIANCGSSGGTASANSLSAGTYRIFADSDGPQNQIIDIAVGAMSTQLSVPTNTGTCDFLVATIELPSGQITAGGGEQVNGSWSCSTNQNTSCN